MPTHRLVSANGITMHIAEEGEGPLVLLLHGWPETSYTWRHQFGPLADAGYHVVAPDQRGYGRTDAPASADDYTIFHLVGDVVGLIEALGERQAIVVGHDWGAPVAWHTALLRPDLVRGVAGLSVPPSARPATPPLRMLRSIFGDGFYQLYFQAEGMAEAEFERDIRTTFRKLLAGSAGAPIVRPGEGFLDLFEAPASLPLWLTDLDLDVFVEQFSQSGFAGGLNWYRNIDRNWALTAPWQGVPITPPALYLSGERDVVRQFSDTSRIKEVTTDLRAIVDVPDAGHWVQQERPGEVNSQLLRFFRTL